MIKVSLILRLLRSKYFFYRAKLKSEDGLDVKFVQLDITDIKSVEAAAATIEKAEGKLDVLINNAGIKHIKHPNFFFRAEAIS
jgi:NAD(P)-dependent dehydrogenase (short-subunit alcohol dehydrogenase family)